MTRTPAPKRRVTTEKKDWMHKQHMETVADTLKVSYPGTPSTAPNPISASQIENINDRELHSIYALLAYVAYNQNVRQETVQMIVEAQFGVDHVAKIHRNDYMNAIEFLVDLKMDEVIN